jgi:L-serine dehydratase
MYRIGKQMPCELRETAMGGLATTPTGLKLKEKIFGIQEDNSSM